jgi:hypothetical protein
MLDLGTQKVTWNGETKQQHKIMLGFELINELMEDGRPFTVNNRYTLSGFANSQLRKAMEGWRAKAYTDDEFAEVDFTRVVGVPAMLTLTESKDEKYTNITAISKLPSGTPLKPLVNPKQILILSTEEFDKAMFDSLSDGLKKIIEASPEYQAIQAGTPITKPLNELHGDELPPF